MKVTDSPGAWRAVAHPLRRRLVDLLADGPKTTGTLARAFTVSRFAVMKHLAVLERSGILAVRRDGRERWNVLTVGGPLELLVREAGPQGAGLSAGAGPSGLPIFRVEERVLLDASPSRVFDALTFNVSAWWGAPYVRSSRATNVVLEPQLGGRFFEEWGHRQGFLRGTVVTIRQDERIEVAGRIAGEGFLPASLEFALEHAGRGTRLVLVHRGVADEPAGGPRAAERYRGAWLELIGARLKAFVEDGVRSGIAERPPNEDALFGWF